MSILDLINGADQLVKPEKTVAGVVPGIVTNNKDPEKMGRVKVKFPWLSEQNESNWARVAAGMSGKEMGSFFLPEVNDEVLLCFEHGDINFPYVIGSLWNGKAGPPETNEDGKNNIRKIKSRNGHEIILDDTAGKEQVCILSKSGHKCLLDDTSGKENVLIQDKSGSNKILIDTAKNAITIESGKQLDIKSTKINIEASAELTLKGGKVLVEGDGTVDVKAGGVLSIKGSLVKIN